MARSETTSKSEGADEAVRSFADDFERLTSSLLALAPALLNADGAALARAGPTPEIVAADPTTAAVCARRDVLDALIGGAAYEPIAVQMGADGSWSHSVVPIPLNFRREGCRYLLIARCDRAAASTEMNRDGARYVSDLLVELLQQKVNLAEIERERNALIEAIKVGNDTLMIYDENDRVLCAIEGRSRYQDFYNIFRKGRCIVDIHYEIAQKILQIPEHEIENWVTNRTRHTPEAPFESERETSLGRGLIKDAYSADGLRVTSYIDLTAILGKTRLFQETARQVEVNASALKDAHREMKRQAMTDDLTGLSNRRAFNTEIEQRTSAETTRESFWLLHLDLDRFKAINDTLGHQAGDQVLRHVADTLRSHLAPNDFVARIGGDEFIVLTEADRSATETAEMLINALSQPIEVDDETCAIGASIGLVFCDADDATDIGRLMSDADIALYDAKERGRGRYAVATDTLRDAVRRRKTMSDSLCLALQNQEFFPLYQPQYDMQTGSIIGVEALVRWRHPEMGVLTPGDFLPLAERLRIICDIDYAILRTVAEHDEIWRAQGLELPCIAVNISSERLRDPSLIDDIETMPRLHGRLVLEVLESVFSDRLEEATHDVLHKLSEYGVRIDVDDFGMGHSSLMGLLALKPERLKISREFVAPLPSSTQHANITRFIIGIAESLGIDVVAEGVETAAQRDFLRDAGCQILQGYYFARPMTADALFEHAAERGLVSQRARA